MKTLDNPVCRILGIRYPLIQAPMNWINNAEMVAAVSNAGALGVLGPNAGPKIIDGRKVPTEERISLELARVRRLTSAPVGINIFSANDDGTRAYAMKTIAAAKANDVNVYCLVGTFDDVIYSAIKEAGGIIVHRELTPTPESARVAEEHGADIIVATGIDEGGMLPSSCMGTFTIVPAIVDANVANVKKAVELAKETGASVEAELGSMGRRESGAGEGSGGEDDTKIYTDPIQAAGFVKETGIDALACSFGTTHGIYLTAPKLDFDVVKNVRKETGGIPVVMHGGSGVSKEDFHRAVAAGVRKINYFTYMDKAAGAELAKYVGSVEDDMPVFFTEAAARATEAMKENVMAAMKVFANRD